MFGENRVVWDSQSHEKSVDIKVQINGSLRRISAKGGVIKDGLLTVSSYRLTTFNRLEDKLNFIRDQHKNFDFYLICAREKDDQNKTMNYVIIKTPAGKLAPLFMLNVKNWRKTRAGYELKRGLGFEAKIVFKMSNQLWYKIPLDYFSAKEKLINAPVPFAELGGGLIEFLKRNRSK